MQRRNKKSKFGSSGFAPKSETEERIGKVASALANRMGANIQEGKGPNFHSTPSGTISTSSIAGLGSSLDSAGKDNTVFNTGAVLPKNTDSLKSNEKRAGFGFKLTSAEFAALSRRAKAAGIKTGDSPAEITAAINKVKQGEVRDQIKQIAKNFKTDVQFGEFLVDLQKELEIARKNNQQSDEYLTRLSKEIFDQKTKMLGDIWTKGIAYDKYDFGKDFEDINNKYKDDPMSKGVAFSGKDAMEPPAKSRAAKTPPSIFDLPIKPTPDGPFDFPRPGPQNPLSAPRGPDSPRAPSLPRIPAKPGYPQGMPFPVVIGGAVLIVLCVAGVCYVIHKQQKENPVEVPDPFPPDMTPTGSEPNTNPSRGPTRYQDVDNQTPPEALPQSGFDDDPPDGRIATETPPFRFPPVPPPGNPNIDPFSPINDPKPFQPIPNNPTKPLPGQPPYSPEMPNINPRPGVGPGNKPLPLLPHPGPANPLSPHPDAPRVPNQPGYPQGIPFIITVGGVALVIICLMGVCHVIRRHQEQPGTPPVPNPPNPSPSPTGSEPNRNPSRGPTRYQGVDNQTP